MSATTDTESTTNSSVTTRQELMVVLLAAVIALLLVSVLITRTSQAAFTARTDNPSNDFVSGSLTLENDPDGDGTFGASTTAKFTEIGLVPGDTGGGCIDVKYSGSVAAADLTNVMFYATNLVDTDGSGSDTGTAAQLSDDLDLDISVNDGTCAVPGTQLSTTSGTLASFDGDFTTNSWDSTWKPAANGEVHAFNFTWTLGADTLDDAQGDSAAVTLVWEVNSQ